MGDTPHRDISMTMSRCFELHTDLKRALILLKTIGPSKVSGAMLILQMREKLLPAWRLSQPMQSLKKKKNCDPVPLRNSLLPEENVHSLPKMTNSRQAVACSLAKFSAPMFKLY